MLTLVVDELEQADRFDLSRASADSSTIQAKGGGEQTGPNPTDRGRKGSKHHLLTDRQGHPLVVELTAANVNEGTILPELLEAVPPTVDTPGKLRRKEVTHSPPL